jgi:hypothetical protein
MIKGVTDQNTLLEVIKLRVSLEKLGVSTAIDSILAAAGKLACRFIDQGELDLARQVTDHITATYAGQTGESWQLLNYCLSIPDLAKHNSFPKLSKSMLGIDWEQSMWTIQEINSEPDFALDLTKLLVAMRNSVTIPGATTKPVPEILNWLSQRAVDPQHLPEDPAVVGRLRTHAAALDKLSSDWPILQPWQQLGDQFLRARELLSDPASSFLGFPREQLAGVNQLLSLTRDLYRNWESGDLKACNKALRQLFSLEPDANYLPQIAEQIRCVEEWVKRLTIGIGPEQTATELASQLAADSLPLTRLLGQPDWLAQYRYIAASISSAQDLTTLRQTALGENWPVPWLHYQTTRLDLPLVEAETGSLNFAQLEALQVFHLTLRRGFPTLSAMEIIREVLPGFHQGYFLIEQAVESAFSPLTATPELWPIDAFPVQDRPKVSEIYKVLEQVRSWQTRVHSGQSAKSGIKHPTSDWKILLDLSQAEAIWFGQILPLMTKIRQKHWSSLELPKGIIEPELLANLTDTLAKAAQYWSKVTDQGIFLESSQEFIYLFDKAQANYFEFWQRLQKTELKPLRWLVDSSQPFFSQINQSLLQISRHFRAISRALEVVNTADMARTKLAQNSAGDLMYSLVQLESLLQPPTRKRSVIREWQKQYFGLLSEVDREQVQLMIERIESIHPLLPWFSELVRRDADYFSASDLQKW